MADGRRVAKESAEELIARCCAAPDRDVTALAKSMDGEAWSALTTLAKHTRTTGLVLRALEGSNALGHVAKVALGELRDGSRAWAMKSLQQMRDLARILDLLEAHGLRPIALKGVALALEAYPNPALRPLRDVDLLLDPEETLAAQKILLDHPDFAPLEGAGRYGIEFGHQLPEIVYRPSGMVIELHHRLHARGWPQEGQLVEAMQRNAYEAPLLDRTIRVPSAEDNLFHLIEHATLHHMFANGPLILADTHFLSANQKPAWDEVERRAGELGLSNCLGLIGTLAARNGADWVPRLIVAERPTMETECDTAHTVMFASDDDRERHAMLQRLAERSSRDTGWRAALRRALKPNPYEIAKLSGRDPASSLRWLGYPVWLFRKAKLYLATHGGEGYDKAALARMDLAKWLRQS